MNDVLVALKKDLVERYFAEDGLARLDLKDEYLDSVNNDNGMLFASIFYYVLDNIGGLEDSDKDRFIKGVTSCEVEPGLYKRKSMDPRLDAHDNALGIAAGSLLFDLSYANDIVRYGNANGYNYNNVNPGVFLLSQIRQGGEVAIYKMCAGHIPAIWEFIWLMCGLLSNVFSENVSTTQLCWLRCECLKRAFNRYTFWPWMILTFGVVHFIWLLSLNYRFRSLSGLFALYYINEPPTHPIRRMAKYV